MGRTAGSGHCRLFPTFRSRLHSAIFNDLIGFAQFADYASILFINEDDSSARMGATTSLSVRLSGGIICGIVRRQLFSGGFPGLLRASCRSLGGLRRRGALEKGRALSEDGLKSVNILLKTASTTGTWELDASKGATVRAQIPTRNQVTGGRLMIDLSGCWEGEIQLGREMKVEIEIIFDSADLSCVCKWGGCRHHEKRESLGTRRGQGFLLAIGDVVGLDALDSVEELWILACALETSFLDGMAALDSAGPTCCAPDMTNIPGECELDQ